MRSQTQVTIGLDSIMRWFSIAIVAKGCKKLALEELNFSPLKANF